MTECALHFKFAAKGSKRERDNRGFLSPESTMMIRRRRILSARHKCCVNGCTTSELKTYCNLGNPEEPYPTTTTTSTSTPTPVETEVLFFRHPVQVRSV